MPHWYTLLGASRGTAWLTCRRQHMNGRSRCETGFLQPQQEQGRLQRADQGWRQLWNHTSWVSLDGVSWHRVTGNNFQAETMKEVTSRTGSLFNFVPFLQYGHFHAFWVETDRLSAHWWHRLMTGWILLPLLVVKTPRSPFPQRTVPCWTVEWQSVQQGTS